jgi:nucleoid-associated protein YgaU
MSMFEEVGGGGGGKKKKWIMIAAGTGIILIILVIKKSQQAAAAQAGAAATAAATPQPDPAATITDTGAYPSDTFGGGISGTGMDQTLSTYLAIADQNTSVQMGAISNQLSAIQDQMKTGNINLQDQITAINSKQNVAAIAQAPAQPITTTTPAASAHPSPTSVTHVVTKGETLYGLAVKQYGSPHAAMVGGIKTIQTANPNIKNPNLIYAGQSIKIPTKMS